MFMFFIRQKICEVESSDSRNLSTYIPFNFHEREILLDFYIEIKMFELSQIQLKSIKLKIYFNVKLCFDLFVSQNLKMAFLALLLNNELFILLH